jgi:hypothetical protein
VCLPSVAPSHARPIREGPSLNQHHKPDDALQAELEALGEQFEAEERQDRRAEAQRRRKGLPEPERDIHTFPGFADGGAAPRA